ncbi:hypothetical protein J6590_060025 [Homalodisca vitripennis]|nr:hypothetical protein J6590_060025 [Homalodisca vitripennis]
MATAYSPISGYPPRLDFTQRRHQANSSSLVGSAVKVDRQPSSADAASATSELRLTALPQKERSSNLKSTPTNGMTTTMTTIDKK